MPHDPHEEFQELCALATTGELAAEEWVRLNSHLAHCTLCRQAKQQYDDLVSSIIPAFAAEAAGEGSAESVVGAWRIEEAQKLLMESLSSEPDSTHTDSVISPRSPGWNHVWKYPAAAMVLASLGLACYQLGTLRQREREVAAHAPGPSIPALLPQQVPRANSTPGAHENKETFRNDRNAQSRSQVRRWEQETTRLQGRMSQLELELARRSGVLDQSLQDRADLSRELNQARANAQILEARLAAIGSQTSQDTANLLGLRIQIRNLKASLEDNDKQIAHEQALLEHDQDIRNVIGARNLYIAEIYDVSKNGDTQKPFGRIFYTKDQSLLFYPYDLDQEHSIKRDSAFQAWGRRDADGKHDVSLGLLYQDNANQKRWVLRFNDAKTIERLDAVYITVEPEGASAKPSGKQLLFTYLRLDPNHP